MSVSSSEQRVDVVLVGGGIMSATLGSLMQELMPDLRIQAFERLHRVALESSQTMNNAGTGHAGNCELNYTPSGPGGKLDTSKAQRINAAYEVSLQLWARRVETGLIDDPRSFLNPVPHLSFVEGEDTVGFLKARQRVMSAHPMFSEMEITDDPAELADWVPLLMEGRSGKNPVAATRVSRGSDVNFGSLTQTLFDGLKGHGDFELHLNHEILALRQDRDGDWRIKVKDLRSGKKREIRAGFVFLGAGGAALRLLQKSGIPEGRGYGGFPVSGQWLVCSNADVVARHQAKVYGQAPVGAPPMSVPHLDTRLWGGTPALLFGPYASFTTRYLKTGSLLDLFASLKWHNLAPMLRVAWDNSNLHRYLIEQAIQSHRNRISALRKYYPNANPEDWRLAMAGVRVQIITRDEKGKGKLQFGTEVVTSKDGSLAALLGASPGASTATATMLEVIERCFPERTATTAFRENLAKTIPSWGQDITQDLALLKSVRSRTNAILGLGQHVSTASAPSSERSDSQAPVLSSLPKPGAEADEADSRGSADGLV